MNTAIFGLSNSQSGTVEYIYENDEWLKWDRIFKSDSGTLRGVDGAGES